MPLIRCTYSGDGSSKEAQVDIMKALSSAAAAALGKPESLVLVHVEYTENLMLGGSLEPSAVIQVSVNL
jgi:phenylpyruvate tautomerase PptA (4-oxalocrotonate tautomerase family)